MARSLTGRLAGSTLAGVVGFLAFVELTSGVLQGYYTPMLTDIARHLGVHDADVNWLEGSQLMLSALVVPALAKLGDMVGHRRILLWSTAVTAAASLVLPFTDSFAVFLVAWAVQRGTSVIPKSTNPARLAQNLAAASVALSDADMRAIAAIDRRHRFFTGGLWTIEGSPYTQATLWD